MTNSVSDAQKHSAAHVMAMAVCRLYKNVKIGVGPVTREGFYYDFDLDEDIKEEDLPRIEAEINKIVQSNLKFQQVFLQRDQAVNLLLQRGQIYKAELVKLIPDQEVSFFKTGEEFIDLCRGPHVSSTNQIGVVTLTKIENTFWNEDPSRPKMIRIYGKVFRSIEDLMEYKKLQEDLKEKNYQNLSIKFHYGITDKENDLVFTERGTTIYKKIEQIFITAFKGNEFKEVELTKSFSNELELDSDFYSLVKFDNASYRDFPYRYRLKANLSSLSFSKTMKRLQVLSFRYLNKESDTLNLFEEMEYIIKAFKKLDIDFSADIYSIDFEETIAKQISNFLQRNIISHNKIIKETKDTYAFIKVSDKYEKEWILSDVKIHTIPKKKVISVQFNIYLTELWKYIIERNEGIMPEYLSPVDIVCIPINKNFYNYAGKVNEVLVQQGFSSYVNNRSQSLNRKIRNAEKLKIPFQLVIGQKEQANSSVSLREDGADSGLVSLESLVQKINQSLRR